MKPLLAFLLVLAGLVSYLIVGPALGWYQPIPFVHFLVALVGLLWLFRLHKRSRGIMIWVYQVAGWLLFLLFGWWTLFESSYGPPPPELRAGRDYAAILEQVTLADAQGQPVNLRERIGRDRGTLLVFFRGFW